MLKEELMSIHAALGIVENLSEGEEMKIWHVAELVRGCRRNLEAAAEQAEALESNLAVVSVDLSAEETEIKLNFLTVSAKGIKIAGVLPERIFKEVV